MLIDGGVLLLFLLPAWTGNSDGDTADETRSPEPRPSPSHSPVAGPSRSAGTQTVDSPNSKMCQTSDSENEGENAAPDEISMRSPRKHNWVSANSKRSSSVVPMSKDDAELHPLTEAEMNTPTEEEEVETPKKVDRRKRTEPRTVFKKPVLFTLNPLCVPVNMLNLRSNTGS